jgi:hypothetical protein
MEEDSGSFAKSSGLSYVTSARSLEYSRVGSLVFSPRVASLVVMFFDFSCLGERPTADI